MVGTKKKNVYRRTRKGKGFKGHRGGAESSSVSEVERQVEGQDSSAPEEEQHCLSATRRKMLLRKSTNTSQCSGSDDDDAPCYRLIDLNQLSVAMNSVHKCEGKLEWFIK